MSTPEQIQADAASLVAMSVADLVAHLETVDLETLKAALEAEQGKGDAARKGALAALSAAIEGHPEQAADAAAAAEADAGAGGDEKSTEQPPADEQQEPPAEQTQPEQPEQTEQGKGEVTPAPAAPAPTEDPQPNEPLADKPSDPDAVSAAPARPHDGLVNQLELRWAELKYFVSQLEGEVEDELGEVLAFVRSKL